ncbi:hypothetical protein [Paenibacillus sp. JDR-2]|uniref:hypothetical protein n=1 Tax=Paenibacillus sp. (strain JDR-2) TaxID=324057 RepID=UPI0001663ACF|nr:hypothetical protein [Paenibacillus sp. JDR-2]ACT00874.1 hypothetical protein Pjdr2_2218 [Paenibacillus sp. JDR-2]
MTSEETQWINDYLDLYNYAKQIGDQEWQRDISRSLAGWKEQASQQALSMKAAELWRKFDVINRKMLDLYRQLRNSDDSSDLKTLREEVWLLKLQRVELSRQFKESF